MSTIKKIKRLIRENSSNVSAVGAGVLIILADYDKRKAAKNKILRCLYEAIVGAVAAVLTIIKSIGG